MNEYDVVRVKDETSDLGNGWLGMVRSSPGATQTLVEDLRTEGSVVPVNNNDMVLAPVG